jgi:hypothetical protein
MRHLMVIAAIPFLAIAGAAQAVSREALVGSWVFPGEECQGDSGVTFRANGDWSAYDLGGTWSLKGNRLVTLTRVRGSPEQHSHPVVPPKRHIFVILRLSDRRLVERWDDGTVHSYVRCP